MGLYETLASFNCGCMALLLFLQTKVRRIELVPGYGVLLTQKQLDAAINASRGNATRLIRNLTGIFFPPEVLAVSSAMGTRKHQGLDNDVVEACIRKSINN